MKRTVIFILGFATIIGGGWIANDRISFDRTEWLADYQQLQSAIENQYANLQWSRTSKNVDLVTLNETTLKQLHSATSSSEARRALNRFVAGFNDGHFHIESNPPRVVSAALAWFDRPTSPTIGFDASPVQACRALGFASKRHELAVVNAAPLAKSTFAAGFLATNSGRKAGVIRIPLFRQREYAAVCESSWPQFRANRSGSCDEGCQADFDVVVKHQLAQALADDARTLLDQGAEWIVIDLTGNGGGTEWAEFAASALSPRPLRHPAVSLIRAISDSAAVACDLSQLWTDRNAQPECWNVVPSHSAPQETDSYARPFSGPLYIMTDAKTASASEQFAATLRDNDVVRTVGTKTMGIGCGYVDGGNPVRLRHSGLVVWMPNCVRFRADGTNEFEGVTPDFAVDWGADNSTRTAALLKFLDGLPRH